MEEKEIIYLCNVIKQVFEYLGGTIVVALLLGIASNYIYSWLKERKNELAKVKCELVKGLTPEDFGIQKYKKAHVSRESDATIESLLEKNEEYILITGKPKIGKTRASYEAIRKFENFLLIKPRPEEIEIEKIIFPPWSNKNLILFLDDLEEFIDMGIEHVINILKKKSKKLIVVATCRTGEELNRVKTEIYRQFTTVELEEISEGDWKILIGDIRKEDKNLERNLRQQFDGTPGSATLDLEDMRRRYKGAGDSQVILKSLKLLRSGNLFLYKEDRVKDVCRDIFDLPSEKIGKYSWDGLINNLKENSFITIDKDIIDIYPSYLDSCVYDYDPSPEDLTKLKDLLVSVSDSKSLLYLGNEFIRKKDLSSAKECCSKALKINPRHASAHNQLGYISIKLGEIEESKARYGEAEKLYKEAEKEYRRTIEINFHYAVGRNSLGYTLTKLGEIKEKKGEYDEAKELYRKAEIEHRITIAINSDYSSAHRCLAYVLGVMGKYEEAEKEYKKAIKLNAESPFVHNLFGHLLANKLGKDKEAEKEYREAIRIKSDYPSAHNNLGHLLTKLGRCEEAEKEYREALRISPDYIVAYVNLGHLLIDIGKYKEAERECRKALSINSNYAEANITLSYALVKLERYDEAEKECRTAIKLNRASGDAYRNLGYLLAKIGKHEEAEEEYKKALKINPDDEDTLICLGISLEKLNNRNEEAENCYKEVIEKNPKNIKALITYGYFLSSCGRTEEAIKVLKNYPDDTKICDQRIYLRDKFYELSSIHAHRARALIKSEKFDEAKEELLEALKLNPSSALAYKNLGILQEELGDRAQNKEDKLKLYKEAEEGYIKAIELNDMYPSAHRHLANLLAKIGRYKEAENEYRRGKKVVADYPKNNRDFGIFLRKLGRKEEARKEFEIAVKLFESRGDEKEADKVREWLKNL